MTSNSIARTAVVAKYSTVVRKCCCICYTLVSLNGTPSTGSIQTMHHIVADGWSYPVIFGDIVAHYNEGASAAGGRNISATTWKRWIDSDNAARAGHLAQRYWTASHPPRCSATTVDGIGEHRSVVRGCRRS